jgi:hypothetical protein
VKAPGDITITEEQFDRLSKKNVERWISAHLIVSLPRSLLQLLTLMCISASYL